MLKNIKINQFERDLFAIPTEAHGNKKLRTSILNYQICLLRKIRTGGEEEF